MVHRRPGWDKSNVIFGILTNWQTSLCLIRIHYFFFWLTLSQKYTWKICKVKESKVIPENFQLVSSLCSRLELETTVWCPELAWPSPRWWHVSQIPHIPLVNMGTGALGYPSETTPVMSLHKHLEDSETGAIRWSTMQAKPESCVPVPSGGPVSNSSFHNLFRSVSAFHCCIADSWRF